MELPNLPDDYEMVVRSGKALCDRVLEPVLEKFGRFWITFGYMCRQAIEADMPESAKHANPRSSNPHQWDRGTFGNQVYARVDIWPICVEDGEVGRHDFGKWIMHECDVDLLMQWTRSNVYCITISPKSRRVWLEWGDQKKGEPRQTLFMGADYWQRVYPTLAENERPKFGPSHTGGAMQWRGQDFDKR